MFSLFATYAYLTTTLILFGLFLIAYWMNPSQRRPMLLASLIALLHTPIAFIFIPDYWDPVRTGVMLGMCIEDVLLIFASGGLIWLCGAWPFGRRLQLDIRFLTILKRYPPFAVLAAIVVAACLWMGIGPIAASAIGLGTLICALLCLRPDLWGVALSGGVGFCVLWAGVLRLMFTLVPEYSLQWNWPHHWGPVLWGMPAEEWTWGAVYGAVRALFMAFIFDARIMPAPLRDSKVLACPASGEIPTVTVSR